MTKTLRFRLAEIGLGAGTPGKPMGEELSVGVNISALGHQLLRVTSKPNEATLISMVGLIHPMN